MSFLLIAGSYLIYTTVHAPINFEFQRIINFNIYVTHNSFTWPAFFSLLYVGGHYTKLMPDHVVANVIKTGFPGTVLKNMEMKKTMVWRRQKTINTTLTQSKCHFQRHNVSESLRLQNACDKIKSFVNRIM